MNAKTYRTKVWLVKVFQVGVVFLLLLNLSAPLARAQSDVVPSADIILVVDESNSMWSASDKPDPGTGNPGWRIIMVQMITQLLGVDQLAIQHRVGLVLFGGNVGGVYPLTPVQDTTSLTDLNAWLDQNHQNLQLTNIPAALQSAYDELNANGRNDPNVKKAVVFLSDGHCELHAGMTDDEVDRCNDSSRQIIQSNAQYPVFTIAFTEEAGGGGFYTDFLEEIGITTNAQYYQPAKTRAGLQEVYEDIYRRLLGLQEFKRVTGTGGKPQVIEEPTTIETTSPSEVIIVLQEKLKQIIFTVVKDNKFIEAKVYRPSGQEIKPTDTDVSYKNTEQVESYGLLNPDAGQWKVILKGGGQVTIITVPFKETFVNFQWLKPELSSHPQGKPMLLVLMGQDRENKTIIFESAELSVKLPDGSIQQVPLIQQESSYQALYNDTSQQGDYELLFNGTFNSKLVEYPSKSIKIIGSPWLKLITPTDGFSAAAGQPLQIQGHLMFQTVEVGMDPASYKYQVMADLFKDGAIAKSQELQIASDGQVTGQLVPDIEGAQILQVRLAVTDLQGAVFNDTNDVQVNIGSALPPTKAPEPTQPPRPTEKPPEPTKQPAPTVKPAGPTSPPPAPTPTQPAEPLSAGTIAGIAGGLALLAALGGVGWWFTSKPALSGTLERASGEAILLSGKRPVVFGSDPRSMVYVEGENVSAQHAVLQAVGSRNAPVYELRSHPKAQGATFRVNGQETLMTTLNDGDKIEIGGQTFTFSNPLATPPEQMSSDDSYNPM